MGRIRAALATAVRERTRWPALDGIRGMAIVAVVAYHSFKLAGGWTARKIRTEGVDWWWWPLGGGRLGVDLFFVLSGFLLFFSWRGTRNRHPHLGGAVAALARGRAVRILPPYYAMLLVYVPLLAPELFETAGGLWHLFLFATVQQFNEPDLPNLFNTPLWTLTVEVQFYALVPLAAYLIRRTRPATPLLASLALTLWWVDHRGVYPTSWLLGRSDQFVAGMAVASLVQDHLDGRTGVLIALLRSRWTAWALAGGAAVVYLYHGSTLGLPQGRRYDEWAHPALGLLLAGLVAHLVVSERPGWARRFLERPVPRVLGHLSYGIYLWHFPIYEHALDWTGNRVAGLAIATAATLAVSVASYAWVERPFLERKVRTALQGNDVTRAAPSAGTGAGRAGRGRSRRHPSRPNPVGP